MKTMTAARELHAQIDEWLKSATALPLEHLNDKPAMNSCAYYVLLFAQFERLLDYEFEQVIGPAGDFPFMFRVRNLKSPHEAAEIEHFYEQRNEIAHGRMVSGLPFEVEEAFEQFLGWVQEYT